MESLKLTKLVLFALAILLFESCAGESEQAINNGDKQDNGKTASSDQGLKLQETLKDSKGQPEKNAKVSDDKNLWRKATSVYDFTANNAEGEPVSLEKYRGNVLLIVNVASRCGLTNINYDQLIDLDEKYRDQGLRILAFPCNQFAGQEPGSSKQIFANIKKRGVDFDVFQKIDVNGRNAHPLWRYLQKRQSGIFGGYIKWNFTKFLINKQGQPVKRYAPATMPLDLVPDIEKLLRE